MAAAKSGFWAPGLNKFHFLSLFWIVGLTQSSILTWVSTRNHKIQGRRRRRKGHLSKKKKKKKLNAWLAERQRADLLQAIISANKISLPQGQSFTERKCLLTAPKFEFRIYMVKNKLQL